MDNKYITEWNKNASEWNAIIECNGITSRNNTNPAIIKVVNRWGVSPMLDCGSGEGWLIREIAGNRVDIHGLEGSKELVDIARSKSNHCFYHYSYQEMIDGISELSNGYSTLIFNYALFEKDITPLLLSCHTYLKTPGRIIIQTVHPYFLLKNGKYASGTQDNIWDGLNGNFEGHLSWYARTLEDWAMVFYEARFTMCAINECIVDGAPVSILFTLESMKSRD